MYVLGLYRIVILRPDPDSGLSGFLKSRISGFKKIVLTIKKRKKKLEFTNPQFFTQHKC